MTPFEVLEKFCEKEDIDPMVFLAILDKLESEGLLLVGGPLYDEC